MKTTRTNNRRTNRTSTRNIALETLRAFLLTMMVMLIIWVAASYFNTVANNVHLEDNSMDYMANWNFFKLCALGKI